MKTIILVSSALALSLAVTTHARQVPAIAPDQIYVQRVLTATPMETVHVKGMPYSADVVRDSVQTLADGNRIVQRTTGRVYRDSEGRMRREDDRASGGPTISITDPVTGTTVTLDPQTRTARETTGIMRLSVDVALNSLYQQLITVRAVPAKPAAGGRSSSPSPAAAPVGRGRRGGGAGNDRSEEILADRIIEGVLASGIRKTTTIEKGAIGNEQPIRIVSEEWTSSELQVLVLTDLADPRTGRSTYRLLKINRAEPDPSLFQVPAGYTVQSTAARGGAGAGAGGRGRRGGGGL